MTTYTQAEIMKFLCGEGPLEGVFFGDPHPSRQAFWWRKYLAGAPSTSPEPMTHTEAMDLLPTNTSMSRTDALIWMLRATERHHKIGAKPQAAPSTITDQQAEAAIDAWFEVGNHHHTDFKTRMRLAIDAALAAPSTSAATTGWDNGLMQDYDKGLSRALSEKLDSREVVRDVFPAPSASPLTDKDQIQKNKAALLAQMAAPSTSPTNGWIAAKDQMPPPQVRVLGFEPQHGLIEVDMWFGPDFTWGYSYWMPLPTPPIKGDAA